MLTFTQAMIKFPDGTVKTVDVEEWDNFQGDTVQIVASDGSVYRSHSSNIMLLGKDIKSDKTA